MRYKTKAKGMRKVLALFLTFTMFLSVTGGGLVNAAGGSYKLDFRAANPTTYDRFFPEELAQREGRHSDPLPGARFTDGVESLMPQDMMMGQIVPFEVEIAVNGSTAPENGEILLTLSFATELSNGGKFGFDPAWGIHSAFIDTSESIDPGGDASAQIISDNIGSFPSGQEYIEGVIRVSGLDDGDKAILEIWVVLLDHIPPGVNLSSNIQSAILDAQTASQESISVGNQTVPLLNPGDFLTVDTDVKVVKTDNPDPVYAGQTLTYTIRVSNLTRVAANGVIVTDTLDPNVTFISASDGGTAVGQVVTWPAINLAPNYTPDTPDANTYKDLTLTVQVNNNAPTANFTGTSPDNRGSHAYVTLNPPADILNKVAIAVTITDDTNADNNTWQEPTNVIGATGNVTIGGTKFLEGRELKAGEFTFELYDGAITPGEEPIHTATNALNGSYSFPTLNFTLADVGTKTYTVIERVGTLGGVDYDETEYTIIVQIANSGGGILSVTATQGSLTSNNFYNEYTATGSLTLSGNKELGGRDLKAGEFTFVLYEGMVLVDEKANMLDGSFSFDTLDFTLADVGTKTYRVVERIGTLGGVDYDETEYTVTVEISDNEDGTLMVNVTSENEHSLNFENDYMATGLLNLMDLKALTGKLLGADQFWFNLYEGDELLQSVPNLADGRFIFAGIIFDLDDIGTKTYTVVEKEGMLPGITYDATIHTITVEISDNGDGTLKVDVISDNATNLPFRNVYALTDITVKKIWMGPSSAIRDIDIQLYRNGIAYLDPVKLPVGQDTIIFEDLPVVDEMGDPYVYTADEPAVPEGFRKSISEDGLTITNTFIPPPLPQTGEGQSAAAAGILLLLSGTALALFMQRRRRHGQNKPD